MVSKGNFVALFTDRGRFTRYLHSILIGIPSWFVVGVLITFSPEFARALGVQGTISAGNAVMYCYIGLVAGDLASGLLSQPFKSRRKAILLCPLTTDYANSWQQAAGRESAEAKAQTIKDKAPTPCALRFAQAAMFVADC